MKKFISRLFIVALAIGLVAVPQYEAKAGGGGCQTVDYSYETYDNGMGGLWAVDHFKTKVTICPEGEDTYSLTFNHDGSAFTTIDGNSPGGGGALTAGITGTINGGIVYIAEGDLLENIPGAVGPIDFTNAPAPRLYLSPFFDGPYTVIDIPSWGWDYQVTCSTQAWHDNDASETLYGAVGPNPVMGDITQPGNCPPARRSKDCRWANEPRVYREDRERYLQNHQFCQTWSPGYFWYWKAHQELMPGN